MVAALVQLCVDPRLNHELIRIQVQQKLERSGIRAANVFLLNDIGGNPGQNIVNTLRLIAGRGDSVVFGAVLHHDQCLAAQQGMRVPLGTAVEEMTKLFARAGVKVPVLSGQIQTEHNRLFWDDEPPNLYQAFTFGSPT